MHDAGEISVRLTGADADDLAFTRHASVADVDVEVTRGERAASTDTQRDVVAAAGVAVKRVDATGGVGLAAGDVAQRVGSGDRVRAAGDREVAGIYADEGVGESRVVDEPA